MNQEEEKANTEDRIRWLRERGIQIHIPGEENVSDEHRVEYEFKVVKIPVFEQLPFEEIYLKGFLGYPGDQCLELLKSYFKASSNDIVEEIDHDALKNITAELGTDLNINDSTLKKQLQEGGVEAFPLIHPGSPNNYTRISAYLDEASQLKKLSPNTRAIAIAGLCGYDNVPLCGDIYLGKLVVGGHGVIGDGKGPIRNLDLSVEDCNSDAEWLRTAKRFNYEHGLRTNQVTMDAEADGSGGEVVVEAGQDQNSYKWSQSDEDIEISIVVPTGTVSKTCKVVFEASKLQVGFKDGTVLLSITLFKKVRPSDCTWILSQGVIELTLEKIDPGKWLKVEV